MATGRVVYRELQRSYGYLVIVHHENGMISVYTHHRRNLVKTGDRVTRTTKIASTGPHLHLDAWQEG